MDTPNKEYEFYKENPDDLIWWVHNPDEVGEWLFSFDQKKVYNMFEDYPHNLTKEEKKIFDEDNPYWKDFFRDRVKDDKEIADSYEAI